MMVECGLSAADYYSIRGQDRYESGYIHELNTDHGPADHMKTGRQRPVRPAGVRPPVVPLGVGATGWSAMGVYDSTALSSGPPRPKTHTDARRVHRFPLRRIIP